MTNTTYHKETTMTTRTAAQLRTDVLNATRAHMHDAHNHGIDVWWWWWSGSGMARWCHVPPAARPVGLLSEP